MYVYNHDQSFDYAISGPAGFDPPEVVGTGPRYLDIVWKALTVCVQSGSKF